MPSSQHKTTRRAGQMARAFLSINSKVARGILAMYDKSYRASVDAWSPDTTSQKSRPHVKEQKSTPRQESKNAALRAASRSAPQIAEDISSLCGTGNRARPVPEASKRYSAPQPFAQGKLKVIRDEGRIGESFREEATSPEWTIHIPRNRPHGYKQQNLDSAIVLPLSASDKQSSSMPYAESARVQHAVTTYPSGQARVITVIRSDPSRRSAPSRRDGRRNSSRRRQEDDENTPLAHFLPLQQYHTYAVANQVRIVKPFVPNTKEKSRMGRVNHRVRYRRAPSIQSQEAVLLTEEALQEYNTVAAPVNEYHPVSVEQRCNAFLENLDMTANPDQPDKHPNETSQTTGCRANKVPARYRRSQQTRSQSPRATTEAAETEKSGPQLIEISDEAVLEPGWSSTLFDSLNDIGDSVGRQTSLLPGWWSKGDEEDKLSGGSFSNRQHFGQRIHRHDSTQLQELLQPKRGYEVRAVQDPRYPRVVSLERRVISPDVTRDERPAWTKIGHHAILSSWQQRTEPKRWSRTRQPSYDVSGMSTLSKPGESSMTNWTNGGIDALLRRSIDGVVDERPRMPSRPPPPPPPPPPGRKGSLWANERVLEGKRGAEGYERAVRSKFVEHLLENAEVLESLGVVGEWNVLRRRSGWLSNLRGGRGRGK
ncbi:hypothetical protein AC579_4516 [Pseudocercospora musae]|uniref:Uncharacterized protein n=1 Tax=Pseudocercospora musae TaxID=113226 RepID=A0A139GVD6_9PEZI|nr:hypothetical protein AC579_4516 [Pseudocercospora musae]